MEQLDYNLLFRWFVGLAWTMRCGTHACLPRTATGCWRAILRAKFLRTVLASPRQGALVRRALHGGWHADRGLGLPKSFSPRMAAARRLSEFPCAGHDEGEEGTLG